MENIKSPCIDICEIDHDIQLCRGCMRSRMEIRDWPYMSEDAKEQMIMILRDRKERYGDHEVS